MVRAVRNFWVELDVDGRNTLIGSGPRSKDGGFDLRIYQRDDGEIIRAATITGTADSDGNLVLNLQGSNQRIQVKTKR